MTRFCLVRHGQTDWNLESRYQGQSDAPLNDTGRAQARALGRQLEGGNFAAIYASDLSRAKETADIIAACLRLPVVTDTRLREINQGEWEGQLVDVIKARYARLWQQRTEDPAGVRAPGGETVDEVAARASAALNAIANRHPDGDVIIASHGLTLATLICLDRGKPVGKAYDVIPENATPVWIGWKTAAPIKEK